MEAKEAGDEYALCYPHAPRQTQYTVVIETKEITPSWHRAPLRSVG